MKQLAQLYWVLYAMLVELTCISLSEIFIEWLKNAMMDERKKRNPKLFKKDKEGCFTMGK